MCLLLPFAALSHRLPSAFIYPVMENLRHKDLVLLSHIVHISSLLILHTQAYSYCIYEYFLLTLSLV